MNIWKKTLLITAISVATGTQAWAGLNLEEKFEAKTYAAEKYTLLLKDFEPATQLPSVMNCFNDLSQLVCIEIPNESTYKNLEVLTYQDLPRKLNLKEGTYDSLKKCKTDIDNVLTVFPNMLTEMAKIEKREGKKIVKTEPEQKEEIAKTEKQKKQKEISEKIAAEKLAKKKIAETEQEKKLVKLFNERLYCTKMYALEKIIAIQETRQYKNVFSDKSQKKCQDSLIDLFDLACLYIPSELAYENKNKLTDQDLPYELKLKQKPYNSSKECKKEIKLVLRTSQQMLVKTSSQIAKSKAAKKKEIAKEETDLVLNASQQTSVKASSQITKLEDADKASLYAYKKLFEIQKTEQYKNMFLYCSKEKLQSYLTDLSDLACLYIPFGLAYENLEELTNQDLPYELKLKQEPYNSLEECEKEIDLVLNVFRQTLEYKTPTTTTKTEPQSNSDKQLDELLLDVEELLRDLEQDSNIQAAQQEQNSPCRPHESVG